MSKICPVSNEKVIYLTCQECDEKTCLKPRSNPGNNPKIKNVHTAGITGHGDKLIETENYMLFQTKDPASFYRGRRFDELLYCRLTFWACQYY